MITLTAGEIRQTPGPKPDFIDRRRRLHAEIALSAVTVTLKLVMWWSDQHHHDCFGHC